MHRETDFEKTQLLAALGSTNWVQRGSRLDVADGSFILVSQLNTGAVGDPFQAYSVIKRLEGNPELGIILPSIPLKEVKRAVIQDLSWKNVGEGHSHRGFLFGVTTHELLHSCPAPFDIL